jgi:putative ABC transport system permease protein
LKIRAGKTIETLDFIQKTVNTIAPNSLFAYEFLDDRLNTIYKAEDSIGKIVQFFSGLSITLACLGLLGLSAYTVESRSKEISIRKILGANITHIVAMISSRFVRLVVVSLVVAIPLTWYAMGQWLNNFAYKITIDWQVFVISSITVLLFATVVTGFHSIRAAIENPVNALRSE